VRRLTLLTVLIFTIYLLGLAALDGELIALAIPLAVYLGFGMLRSPQNNALEVTRTLEMERTRPLNAVRVQIKIVNRGPAVDEILVRDGVPDGLRVTQGQSAARLPLPDGQHTWAYTVQGNRGTYDFQEVSAVLSEHLGVAHRTLHYPLRSRLTVLPDSYPLRKLSIRPTRTRGFAGPIPSRQSGSGTDFFGVREYQLGDPFRWINWRLSARHNELLFSNEFEQERLADVGIILDARERTNIGVTEGSSPALFESSVQAAAALAEQFLEDGNRVGLLVYGRGLDRTFPGYGRHQRERIFQALARATIGDSLVFDSLDFLPTRFFPARSQIVLITPLCAEDPPVLARVRARGYEVLVVSPDPVDYEATRLGNDSLTALAARIAAVERALWLRSLERVGIQVVDWKVGSSLDAAIHAALRPAFRMVRR